MLMKCALLKTAAIEGLDFIKMGKTENEELMEMESGLQLYLDTLEELYHRPTETYPRYVLKPDARHSFPADNTTQIPEIGSVEVENFVDEKLADAKKPVGDLSLDEAKKMLKDLQNRRDDLKKRGIEKNAAALKALSAELNERVRTLLGKR